MKKGITEYELKREAELKKNSRKREQKVNWQEKEGGKTGRLSGMIFYDLLYYVPYIYYLTYTNKITF